MERSDPRRENTSCDAGDRRVESGACVARRAIVDGLPVVPEHYSAGVVAVHSATRTAHRSPNADLRPRGHGDRAVRQRERDRPELSVIEAAASGADVLCDARADDRPVDEHFRQHVHAQADVVTVLETDPELRRAERRDPARDGDVGGVGGGLAVLVDDRAGARCGFRPRRRAIRAG